MKNSFRQLFQRINKVDMFAPYVFFPLIYLMYVTAGLFDFGYAEYFRLRENIALPIVLGLGSYMLVSYLVVKKGWILPSFPLKFLRGKSLWFIYLLGGIGLAAYLIMIFTGQIGILDESIRRNLDPKLFFLSSFLWFAAIFIICYNLVRSEKLTKSVIVKNGSLLAFVFIAFILMGYRTPLAVMFFTLLIVVHFTFKRIKFTWMVSLLVVLALVFSLFGFIRTISEDTSNPFNSRQGPSKDLDESTEVEKSRDQLIMEEINATPKWVRALTKESSTGRIVFSKIMEYTEKEGYLKGELHGSIFSTVLPGEQISPRAQVTNIVNSITVDEGKYVTRPGRTTTPTFAGQLYLEAGNIAIVIGFALYALILSLLYNELKRNDYRSYQTVAYAFITTIFTISIHTGLLDVLFLFMIIFSIITATIERKTERLS